MLGIVRKGRWTQALLSASLARACDVCHPE